MKRTEIKLTQGLEYLWKYTADHKEIKETKKESSKRDTIIEELKQDFLKDVKMNFRYCYFDWVVYTAGSLRSVDKYYQMEYLHYFEHIIWFCKDELGTCKFFLNKRARDNVLSKDDSAPVDAFIRPVVYGRFIETLNKYKNILYTKLQSIHPYCEEDCGKLVWMYVYQELFITNIMLGVRPIDTIQKEMTTWINGTVLDTSAHKTKEEQISYLRDELKNQSFWE